jgi:hypothetical protein
MAVLHFNSAKPESTSPTMRIASFAASELGVPLICNSQSADEHLRTKFDVLFVKYGILKFSNHREQALKIYGAAKRIVNLENDYLFALDKRLRPPDESWSTVEGRAAYVNWNMITRHGVDAWKTRPPLPVPTESGIIYYGAHRENRVASFRSYFLNPPYELTISTFRGKRRFAETCGVATIGAFRDPDSQAQWPLTIYIQDDDSNKAFHSPATRFYECVMAGLAQVIDEASVPTLKKAGIPLNKKEIVTCQADVAAALKSWRSLQKDQRMRWFVDYSKDIRKQFWAAAKHRLDLDRRKAA